MVRGLVQSPEFAGRDSDQGFSADPIARQFPEHGTSETLVRDILALLLYNVGGVITDQLSLGRVVRIT